MQPADQAELRPGDVEEVITSGVLGCFDVDDDAWAVSGPGTQMNRCVGDNDLQFLIDRCELRVQVTLGVDVAVPVNANDDMQPRVGDYPINILVWIFQKMDVAPVSGLIPYRSTLSLPSRMSRISHRFLWRVTSRRATGSPA